jgi:hypothetical protein
MKQAKIDEKLALKWACDCRTIRRWRKAKAPFTSEKRMRSWLAGRQHLPPGTVALLESLRASERATDPAVIRAPHREGAAGALKRLEEAEAEAYATFNRATASGDDVAIKAARENWLRISESLRRFDLAIEQNRRDSGELILRSEVEHALQQVGWCMRTASRQVTDSMGMSLVGELDVHKIRICIERAGYSVAIASYSCAAACGAPAWVIKALSQDVCSNTKTKLGEIEVLAQGIREWMVDHCAEIHASEPSIPTT